MHIVRRITASTVCDASPVQLVTVTLRPNYPGPHDFFILAIVVTSICALLNPTSLIFGIAATTCTVAVISKGQKDAANYPGANSYTTGALNNFDHL